MTHRLSTLMALATLSLALFLPGVAFGQPGGSRSPAADVLKWNLERLNQEPMKLIKAAPDPQKAQVRFLVEFTRTPTSWEQFDWHQQGGPVVFRFLDEDGVVLKTVKTQWDGELLTKPGARMRIVLPMPDEKTLAATRAVIAD